MKQLDTWKDSEIEELKSLLKAKEQGNQEAAVKYERRRLAALTRNLKIYSTHKPDELVTLDNDFYDFFPQTVGDVINEIKEEIIEIKNYLRKIGYSWR